MSIIFGMRAADDQHVEERHLTDLARATERFAPDGTFVAAKANVGMGFQPHHTHKRSKTESQPVTDERGAMLCFDGRLDNHEELRTMLGLDDKGATDSEIVFASFERWGESCFRRFIGDWALALWSSAERALYLARDHAGTRTLYYETRDGRVLWATYLETFFVDTAQRSVDEAYVACYLAGQPTHDLTPYKGLGAVPPAHWVRIQADKIEIKPHWSWLATDEIRYPSDAEYEEHFFSLFCQAVARRTGPGAPILAHLSGGMDSTSIVCMSDYIRAQHGEEPEGLLDTISYYDDSEPSWDERPYFEAVERRRGKRGIHLPLPLLSEDIEPAPVPYLWPGADKATYENEHRLIEQIGQKGYRVILSGIGGDELLGGVPNALPELADLLARGGLFGYVHGAVAWCLVDRTPLLHMTGRVLRFLIRQYLPPHISKASLPPWSTSRLKRQVRRAFRESMEREMLLSRPSSIANGRMGPALLETLPHRCPQHFARFEWRYPYLDRDLVDFLLRVPRSVLVRPGRRRSLMRNALRGIVPVEVLERRRKGARIRAIPLTLQGQERKVEALFDSVSPSIADLVDQRMLQRDVVEAVRQSDLSRMHFVLRAILIQLWIEQTDFGPARNPHSLGDEGIRFSRAARQSSSTGVATALTGRNLKMEKRT
jgi:asparagine synthase (glutamine-hydrolysing)